MRIPGKPYLIVEKSRNIMFFKVKVLNTMHFPAVKVQQMVRC